MTVAEAVAAFGRQIGLGALAFGGDGRVGLSFEQGLEIDLQLVGDDLAITTVIGPMPPDLDDLALERLLAVNMPGGGRGDTALALDPGQDLLVLNRLVPGRDLDLATLEMALEDFLTDRRSLWSRIKAAFTGEASATAEPASAPSATRPDGPTDWMIRA